MQDGNKDKQINDFIITQMGLANFFDNPRAMMILQNMFSKVDIDRLIPISSGKNGMNFENSDGSIIIKSGSINDQKIMIQKYIKVSDKSSIMDKDRLSSKVLEIESLRITSDGGLSHIYTCCKAFNCDKKEKVDIPISFIHRFFDSECIEMKKESFYFNTKSFVDFDNINKNDLQFQILFAKPIFSFKPIVSDVKQEAMPRLESSLFLIRDYQYVEAMDVYRYGARGKLIGCNKVLINQEKGIDTLILPSSESNNKYKNFEKLSSVELSQAINKSQWPISDSLKERCQERLALVSVKINN